MTKNKGDLISREALKEHKFVGNKFVQIGGRTNGKTLENINKAYQQGWNDCIDAIIDNAPTVCSTRIASVVDMFGNHIKGYFDESRMLFFSGYGIVTSELLKQKNYKLIFEEEQNQ